MPIGIEFALRTVMYNYRVPSRPRYEGSACSMGAGA